MKVAVAPGAIVKPGTCGEVDRLASGTPGKLAIRVNPGGTVIASDTSSAAAPVFLTVKVIAFATPTGVDPKETVALGATTAVPLSTWMSGEPVWASRLAASAVAVSSANRKMPRRRRAGEEVRNISTLFPKVDRRRQTATRSTACLTPVSGG